MNSNAIRSAISTKSRFRIVSRSVEKFTEGCFWFALFIAVLSPPQLWILCAAWLCLAVAFAMDSRKSLYALFFFAAFFHPAGLFPNAVFTFKHFQFALVLTAGAQILRGDFFKTFFQGFRNAILLMPLAGLIVISLVSAARQGYFLSTLPTAANLALTLLSLPYLLGLLRAYSLNLKEAVGSFFMGGCLQVIIASWNLKGHTLHFGLDLYHNNHLALLTATSVFYPLTLGFVERSRSRSFFYWTCAAVLFGGILFSCSRVAYLGFFLSFMGLYFLTHKLNASDLRRQVRIRFFWVPVFLIPVTICVLWINDNVMSRIASFYREILDIDSWLYSFNDTQNFGFFGIFRFRQISELLALFQHHSILGTGFTRQTTDFHGLYFTIFSAGGIAGLLLFLCFVGYVLRGLYTSLSLDAGQQDFALQAAAFCALTTWLIGSLTETFFLQFSPWVHVLVALFLIQRSSITRFGGFL